MASLLHRLVVFGIVPLVQIGQSMMLQKIQAASQHSGDGRLPPVLLKGCQFLVSGHQHGGPESRGSRNRGPPSSPPRSRSPRGHRDRLTSRGHRHKEKKIILTVE